MCCSTMCLYVKLCDVGYDFHIKTMFDSSVPPVVFRKAGVFYLSLFACSGVQHILCWFSLPFALFFFTYFVNIYAFVT
jgi:hypothetical protein